MFWNDPNLYGYNYREVPNVPTPFFGQTVPKLPPFAMAPWTAPQVPPITPFYGMNLPFNPQIPPIAPFYGMNPNLPFNPMAYQAQQPLPLPTPQHPFQALYGTQLPFFGLPYRPF